MSNWFFGTALIFTTVAFGWSLTLLKSGKEYPKEVSAYQRWRGRCEEKGGTVLYLYRRGDICLRKDAFIEVDK